MILHLLKDEKVADQIIENFSKVEDKNHFLIFVESKSEHFKHITFSSKNITKFIQPDEDINAIIDAVKPVSILVHAFHLEFAKAILQIISMPRIAWYVWGFDVYGLPPIKPTTYAPLTNAFLLKRTPTLQFARFVLKHNFLRKICYCFIPDEDRYTIIYKALRRVNYFVTYIEGDFLHFKKYYDYSFNFINCPFSTRSQYLAGNNHSTLKDDARNILVGNSNSIESNHLDAFEVINKFGWEGVPKILAPLSYVQDDTYKSFIINKGNSLFPNMFVPLLDFMDRNQYIEMLRSCSTGVFYHFRQQAMGNIIAMLYLGARIYLSRNNPAYSFFVEKGVIVYDFDTDYQHYKNTKIDKAIALKNKEILDNVFSEQEVLSKIKRLTNILS